jgi:glycerophosphoryl diester phosphodiesterase
VKRFFGAPLPRAFGHRGASGTHPENTLVSFRAALEKGAGAFELDVHRSADGEIVVFHDATLERTTNGKGLVRSHTMAELRELDAGFRFSPDGGRTFPFRDAGITIPTLREVCEGFEDTPIVIEIKQTQPPLEEELAQVLHLAGANDHALVFSLHQEPVRRYRAAATASLTGFGPDEVADFLGRMKSGDWESYHPLGLAFAVPIHWYGTRIVSRAFVDAAHRVGCEVYVWTINDPQEMHTLLDLGVDGLITDYPDRMSAVLAERGDPPQGTEKDRAR